ncbi:MAG: ferritin family protein [Rhodospirillales bacterium]
MFCPKCHQPLDGPEEYICCGNDVLQWRCRDCGKVSEGFAFPYGLCPLCDGSLEPLAPREIGDDEALGAVQIAFEIELGGRAFYRQAAATAKDRGLRELFGKLAEMEDQHIETLSRRYHASLPALPERSGVARAAIFAGIDGRTEDAADLLRIAIACETRAREFFEEQSRQMPEGSVAHQLYRELAAEEHEHAELLSTELDRRAEGKTGLL